MSTPFNPADVRATLTERAAVLLRREEGLGKHLRQQDGRLDADFSDRVAFTEGDEVIEALDDAGRAELARVRSALDRLEAGTYGQCAACGEAIGERRLAAMPTASACVACAERAEAG